MNDIIQPPGTLHVMALGADVSIKTWPTRTTQPRHASEDKKEHHSDIGEYIDSDVNSCILVVGQK